MVKRLVYYFDEPGEGNTQLVIEAVGQSYNKPEIHKSSDFPRLGEAS